MPTSVARFVNISVVVCLMGFLTGTAPPESLMRMFGLNVVDPLLIGIFPMFILNSFFPRRSWGTLCITGAFLLCVATEVAQYFGRFEGVYHPGDLIAFAIGAVIAMAINKYYLEF